MKTTTNKRLKALENKVKTLISSENLSLTDWHFEILLTGMSTDILDRLDDSLEHLELVIAADLINQAILDYPDNLAPWYLKKMGAKPSTFDKFKRRIKENQKKPCKAIIEARKREKRASYERNQQATCTT